MIPDRTELFPSDPPKPDETWSRPQGFVPMPLVRTTAVVIVVVDVTTDAHN
jgi:hypothetical protein